MESASLRIRLLGGFELRRGEAVLPPLGSARAESLLASLLLHRGEAQPRQRLAFLLWPDSGEGQARTNLRHLLHTLRRALPEAERDIEVTPRALRWRAEAPVWLDVAAFEEAAAAAERSDGDTGEMRRAVELYAGDLLDGNDDEWLLEARERLRQRSLALLERLADRLEERGEYGEALGYAERLLRDDPLREERHRRLMRLHDARGDRARALHVYHACVALLDRELGVEPSAATREAYEALLTPAGGGGVAAGERGLVGGPPLVGRVAEWGRLTGMWRASERGRAQVVLVTGEPGVGKTRLVEELRAWCGHRGAATAEARSYPAEGALAYGPVAEWLRSAAISPRLGRLERAHQTELARLLPELPAAVPGLAPPAPLPEHDLRRRLFGALARAIVGGGGPLLLVADDLHWADRETVRFLHYLLRAEPAARLLVAATARSDQLDGLRELRAGLHALDRLTEIEIGRLGEAETAALAERLAGRPLAGAAADRLYGETEGNPLFVVEAIRAGWRADGGATGRLSPRVQATIEARLGQVSAPASELLGLAAAVGREFTAEVLAAASGAEADALVRGLDELWRRRLVRERGADGYDFSHDKIREVAYRGLSPARRRDHHRRVAQALEQLHGDDPGVVAGQLADHYERAGAVDQAVAWYGRAADAAQRLHANSEAVRLLDRALDLLRGLPAGPGRGRRELELLTALPAPLVAVEGYGSRRLAEERRRALALARELGVEPAPPLLRSLAIASLAAGDFAAARGAGERLRALGEGDDVLQVEAEFVLGVAAFWQGALAPARGHFETVVERYRPAQRPIHLLRYGLDPKVICQGRLANTLWFMGRPAEAERAREAAVALAEAIGHPFSLGAAHVFSAMLALEMGDQARLGEAAAALATAGGDEDLGPTRAFGEALAGYLMVLDGRRSGGLDRIRRALEEVGAGDPAPGVGAMIARLLLAACVAAGEARAGLATAERLLTMGGGAAVFEAEGRRLRAELLAALGGPEEAIEAELERALLIAQRQGAIAFELRAATSLLRLRRERGDAAAAQDARERLAAVVARYPEPGDSHDQRAAAALLAGA